MKTRNVKVVLALAMAIQLWGQGERGGFDGVITDGSGAVIPGAVVKATEVTTNVDTVTSTTDAGVYHLLYTPAGTYRSLVSQPGIQTSVRENVVLHVINSGIGGASYG